MLGFNGIFSGIVFSKPIIETKPKIKVLSFSEQGLVCQEAAKIYIALLHAELFDSFKRFKKIVFSSKGNSKDEIWSKYQKIYNELLKLAYSNPNKKCVEVVANKKENGKVCKIAVDFFL